MRKELKGFIIGILTTVLLVTLMVVLANAMDANTSEKEIEEKAEVVEYFDDFAEGLYDFFED